MISGDGKRAIREECVKMLSGKFGNLGRWSDNNCKNKYSYVCKKNQNPKIELGTEANNNKKCKSGWKQVIKKNYLKLS